jgi:hypothetical protein
MSLDGSVSRGVALSTGCAASTPMDPASGGDTAAVEKRCAVIVLNSVEVIAIHSGREVLAATRGLKLPPPVGPNGVVVSGAPSSESSTAMS